MKSKKSISKQIITSYIIIGVFMTVLIAFVIWASFSTMGNLNTIEDYDKFNAYPVSAAMSLANARTNAWQMVMSLHYEESVFDNVISNLVATSSAFSEFKKAAQKYNLTELIGHIDSAVSEIQNYENMVIEINAHNQAKKSYQKQWDDQGLVCVNDLVAISSYVDNYADSIAEISQQEYENILANKRAIDNATSLWMAIGIADKEMMYMDKTDNYQTMLDNIDTVQQLGTELGAITYREIRSSVSLLADEFAKYRDMTVQYYELIQQTAENKAILLEINSKLQSSITELNTETLNLVTKLIISSTSQQRNVIIILIVLSVGVVAFIVVYALIMIKSMKTALKSVAESLHQATENINSAAEQLTSAATSLAESGAKQAAAIEETSATMNETATIAQRNTDHTQEAAKLAGETVNSALNGVGEMDRLIEFMEKLNESSTEISKIVGNIDDIAFQTNILALNASIEAVRAGEVGRSFSVVAEEVRTLSLKSADSASNTSVIINENINLASQSVQNSTSVGETLKGISNDVQKVNELISEISVASEEQTQGLQQINIALSQMEKVTQSNAAISQESAAAANELKGQADNLLAVYNLVDALVYGTN